MKLAKIALKTLDINTLVGRNHVNRFNAGIGWNGSAKEWERRKALQKAGMLYVQQYRNCCHVWGFSAAEKLTNEQLLKIAFLKGYIVKHAQQLLRRCAYPPRNTRVNFGKYLKECGLVREEREKIYEMTKNGTTTKAAIILVLEKRKERGLLEGQAWVAVCCHRHYAKGSHALNSIHRKEFNSWVDASNYADSFNTGKHGWANVELREKAMDCCRTCGKQIPTSLSGFTSICKPCSDAWPRVSRQEMRELEEVEVSEVSGEYYE